MNLFKKSLLSPVVALLVCTTVYADDISYSIEKQSLKEAIELISKKSNTPYIANSSLLDGKTSNAIKDVNGTKNALDKVLENSGLEAVIEDGAIIIKKKIIVGSGTVLEEVSVNEGIYLPIGTTEGSGSYTTKSTNTATKLDLSIRETPQSVKVLTREYLDDANIISYQELLNNITGVSANRVGERQDVYARGFNVDYYLFDGVPSVMGPDNSDTDTDLVIYDRVEIIKGANGLMTGAGNPAIGINMIRKHANSKVFKGNIDTSAGSWDNYTISTDIQTPLNSDGSIRARFVAKHQDGKSFLDFYEKQNDIFYGVVDMDLSDTTFVSIGASYQDLNRDGVRYGGLPAFYSDGTRTNFNRSKNVSADWTYWDNKTRAIYTNATQYLYNDISLNLSYVYKEDIRKTALLYYWGEVNKITNLGTSTNFYNWAEDSKYKENNIDVYVSAPFSLGGLDHEIITGFMYNKNEMEKYNFERPVLSNNIIDFSNINLPLSSPITYPNKLNPNKTIQTGVYLANKISLMDDLKLIAGLRISDWEYKVEGSNGNREFNNEITPYTGLIYDIDEHHSVYASYTDIFKPQESKDKNNDYLDPVVGKNYETGIKGEYFDKRLNTALSIFRVEQDGVAEKDTGGVNIITGETAYKAVKGVVSKGAEFEVDGEITDNWNLSFGIANFEAKDANNDKYNTTSSRTTANLFTKYKITKDLGIGGGLNYKSKIYTGSGLDRVEQDAYIVANSMVSYDVTKDTKVQLNINNLFDKKYYEGIGDMYYGEPRNFTLAMKYSF